MASGPAKMSHVTEDGIEDSLPELAVQRLGTAAELRDGRHEGGRREERANGSGGFGVWI